MDPLQTVKTRIADMSRSLDAVEVSSDMPAPRRVQIAATLDGIAEEAVCEIVPTVRTSSDVHTRDEAARLFRRLAQTNAWLDGRDARTRKWIDLAAELASSDVLRDLAVAEQNSLLDSEAFEGIRDLCGQGRVDKARRVLAARRKKTGDPLLNRRITEFLEDPRNFLAPLKGAPSLMTYNGIGTSLWGDRDARPDGTYVSTLCLVVLFLPVLPLKAYLVRREAQGWTFFGCVPLSPFAFWWRRLLILAPLMAVVVLGGWETWNTSAYVTENRLLAEASESLTGHNYARAMGRLAVMAGTANPGRAARMNEMARKAVKAALDEIQEPGDANRFLLTIGPAAAGHRASWVDGEVTAAAETALDRLSARPGAAKTVRSFIEWMGSVSPDPASRAPALAARACEKCDDPLVLAAAADLHLRAGRPCPAPIVDRLGEHLLRARHDTWKADALSYLRAADPGRARPVLFARVEAAWKGAETGGELLELKALPEPLRMLIALDAEEALEKRAEGLEKAAEGEGLEEPQKTWHRLGAARRLSQVCGRLNEKDPTRFPLAKGRPWAIRAAELAPGDGDARVTALRYLLEDGDFARAIAIGRGALDDPRTALLVGIAFARSGRYEEAAAILRPRVQRDLPALVAAFAEWERTVQSQTQGFWRMLQNGTADRHLIARLNKLPQDQASVLAEQWVRQQVERDAGILRLGEKWRGLADVHPAASELAMVELALGRSIPPGAGRQERLQEAERLFLELRKIQQDDPNQELQLGQVYIWLGKEKEGAEIFDRLEAAGNPQVLHQMGAIFRGLFRMDAARRVLEKAYDKADTAGKIGIAVTRALASNDAEEKLLWLRKSDATNPRIRVDIDQTEAEVAIAKGAWGEAVNPLQRAAAYYAGLPESSQSLNNGAVVRIELAQATGELPHQLEALRLMRRAHELSPEDGIVLGNYVSQLEDIGLAALAGSALRADLLHAMPDTPWLDFVVPQPSPQEWAERAKAQPELRRAAELGARAVVLSPDREIGYRAQSRYFGLLRDGPAHRRMVESVESNPPARREDADKSRAHGRGEYTEGERRAVERELARWESLLPAIRKAGHAPTLAHALTRRAMIRLGALRMGLAGVTLDAAVQDAEEAAAAFDAGPTRLTLASLRMERAAREISASDPGFAQWLKEYPGLDPPLLLVLYGRRHPERAEAIGAHDAARRAASAVAEWTRFPPRDSWVLSWAWLELAGHDARESARKFLQSDPTLLEGCRLNRLLIPGDVGAEAVAFLAAEACGDQEMADKIRSGARAAKVFPPFFGE